MNKKLQYTWLHIVALLTLMFIAYVSFLSFTFAYKGDYATAFLYTLIYVAAIAATFVTLQNLKATDHKFARRIQCERVLFIASPIILFMFMQPFNRFWGIKQNENQIEQAYQLGARYSQNLFSDYETYAHRRIDNYEKMLERIIRNKSWRPQEFYMCGFNDTNYQAQLKNKVDVLRIQLLSDNYNNLKSSALSWSQGIGKASIWNIFMMNNIRELGNSMQQWNEALTSFAAQKVSDEEYKGYNKVTAFGSNSKVMNNAKTQLNKVSDTFTNDGGMTGLGFLLTLLAYACLLLPYWAQDRDDKNQYSLSGKRRDSGYGQTLNDAHGPTEGRKQSARTYTDDMEIVMPDTDISMPADDISIEDTGIGHHSRSHLSSSDNDIVIEDIDIDIDTKRNANTTRKKETENDSDFDGFTL